MWYNLCYYIPVNSCCHPRFKTRLSLRYLLMKGTFRDSAVRINEAMEKRLTHQDDTIDSKVREAQIHQLYRQTWTGLGGVLVLAFASCFMFWQVVPQWKISLWAALFILLAVIRAVQIVTFQRKAPSGTDINRWATVLIIGVVLSGLMWSVPAFFLWPAGHDVYQYLWPILIFPVTGAGIATYYTWTSAYVSFTLLTSGPLALRFMYEGGFVNSCLGVLTFFFIMLLLRAGRLMHAASMRSLEFGIRNDALNREMKEEIETRKKLNAQLQSEITERTLSEEKLNRRNQELMYLNKELTATKSHLEASKQKLEEAIADVKQLSGMLPICASCKNIRNDRGYWEQLESYLKDHSSVVFSHGICPDCARKLYPDIYEHENQT
jgi:hypothetical protein